MTTETSNHLDINMRFIGSVEESLGKFTKFRDGISKCPKCETEHAGRVDRCETTYRPVRVLRVEEAGKDEDGQTIWTPHRPMYYDGPTGRTVPMHIIPCPAGSVKRGLVYKLDGVYPWRVEEVQEEITCSGYPLWDLRQKYEEEQDFLRLRASIEKDEMSPTYSNALLLNKYRHLATKDELMQFQLAFMEAYSGQFITLYAQVEEMRTAMRNAGMNLSMGV